MTEEPREDAELQLLLRTLDHDLPAITVEDVIARAERRRFGWGRVAAALAAAIVVASAAYALPGLPVRPWVDGLLSRIGIVEPDGRPAPPSPDEPAPGGIVFDPAEPLAVVFAGPLHGHVRVTLTGDGVLVARMTTGEARYTSEPGRLVVEMPTPDTFDLRVPRSARRVEVRAGGRSVFLKEGPALSATRPAESDGRFLIPLAAATPDTVPR